MLEASHKRLTFIPNTDRGCSGRLKQSQRAPLFLLNAITEQCYLTTKLIGRKTNEDAQYSESEPLICASDGDLA